ncbi:MAG TPA: YbaB/EbfC family nucleoid-associated protein [Stackebrandtia sp.]|uniref:YbaB/EbfC family nucleoid-associated protein n=1 Tax=Stackebrandtia sp. TaxID=2023065 RepID=UPI002D70BDF0|nr:YbaB/EbfC family nucleoid-associated protein [Stackebrandtia sp.]HZE38126.1 YbaB/EbfC family nucleoid-associated protein [Stackebrandtia sp.]
MFPGGEGMPDMQQFLQQAQQVQANYMALQQELNDAEVSASAGGGLVTVTMTGGGEFKSIAIDREAVDPEDVETLEDLVGAAIVAATEEAKKLAQDKFGPLAQSLPGGIGGGQLPGM